jgi:hypothetical protein
MGLSLTPNTFSALKHLYSYLILNPGLEIENGLLVTTCKLSTQGADAWL